MTNIFIANLDFSITSDDLKATFSQFGEVTYAHVVYDNKTKKSRGYGYVEMLNKEEAINAIKALNGLDVNGRELDVKLATPKDQRVKKKEEPPKRKSFDRSKPSYDRDKTSSPQGTVHKREVKVRERRVLRPRRKRTDENED